MINVIINVIFNNLSFWSMSEDEKGESKISFLPSSGYHKLQFISNILFYYY